MNVLIAGGTGFIGSALCTHLLQAGHSVVVKTRQPSSIHRPMKGIDTLGKIGADERFDLAINLAGEPIADKRWTYRQRQKILQSRLDTTEAFIAWFKSTTDKPALFISGSAIGYYGIGKSDDPISEAGSGDDSFSSRLCAQWEASALQAEALGIRTCLLRTGIVLGKGGGALKKMLPPFKLGLGGRIGTGSQWMPWIHLSDMVGIIDLCIKDDSLNGPINCTAPNPVTNAEFTNILAKQLKRPAVCHMPSVMIKLLMGDMGKELLLAGKKVVPEKAENAGFQFSYERLDAALADILS